jgi:CRISPR-associated protein Cas5d
MKAPPVTVKVWGDLACFTRPEMRVERVTYPVMTPSAARGILEAIFWKPQFEWRVREIGVLNAVRYYSILRNEINTRQSERAARAWEGTPGAGYYADEDRAQRHTLALRDVAYTITAEVALRQGATENELAYNDQFARRVGRGQCLHRPALGCREFAAWFGPVRDDDRPIAGLSMDLGLMLGDLAYDPGRAGPNRPRFFEATVRSGVLHVPPDIFKETPQ